VQGIRDRVFFGGRRVERNLGIAKHRQAGNQKQQFDFHGVVI
jgi:hypothetical protein